ncbi:BglG family transcription antiterminator [Enterococcus sp. AZ103]|uniref:BglG family transcription antiterminator n=1 Tax=Enterococcus sp. AZ103 TaxID=2774628 RepID=UPI003F2444EE
MLVISERSKDIILILLNNQKKFTTIAEIAKELAVTSRTVYRQLDEVYEVIEKNQLSLINETGKGFKISGETGDFAVLEANITENTADFAVKNRPYWIIFLLLNEDVLKAEYLSLILAVSVQSIRNDFGEVRKILKEYDLILTMKKGEGAIIEGPETKKRIFLLNHLQRNIDFFEILRLVDTGIVRDINVEIKILRDYEYFQLFSQIIPLLRKIFELGKFQVSDVTFQDYVLLLTIMVKRNQEELSRDYYLTNLAQANTQPEVLFTILKEGLEEEFQMIFSENQQLFLEWVVSINNKVETNKELELIRKVNDFIVFVESVMGCRLRNDLALQNALYEHLDRAISRIDSGITVQNPMLKEIRKNYNKLFQTIKRGAEVVFSKSTFPDDEIGFLTLHFSVALDKVMDRSITALIVCSSGMGSSKMLASRLTREIPEIEIKKIISFLKLYDENLDNYDMVFSTISLPLNEHDYMMVSPLLNKKELVAVNEAINSIRYAKLHRKELLLPQPGNFSKNWITNLGEVSSIAENSQNILSHFSVEKINDLQNLPALYQYLNCFYQQQFPDAKIQLEETAQQSSIFAIPDTQLGYIQYQSTEIQEIRFNVFSLASGAEFPTVDQSTAIVRSIICIVSPKTEVSIISDLISLLTMFIIESPEHIQLFERADTIGIKQLLQEKIRDLILEKIL